jgi:co-chaperonin GroES (HSP10)
MRNPLNERFFFDFTYTSLRHLLYIRKNIFMIHPPLNNILVRIGDTFLRRISDIMKVSAAEAHGSDINPADFVQIVGEVVALPKGIATNTKSYEGYSCEDIRIGDTVIFRYDVVFAWASDKRHFKNMFYYNGREYWVCDIIKVFAVIRKGEIRMQNGYCMIEDMPPKPKIVLAQTQQANMEIHTAILTQIGSPLTTRECIAAEPGDYVYYRPVTVQKYEIKKKQFGIIRQEHIMGYSKGKDFWQVI